MTAFSFLIGSLLFAIAQCAEQNDQSSNEFDTYNADECPRVRRAWHTLSASEQDLYVSGLMQLRKNGEQNVDIDEFIAIGSVHADIYAPFLHKTSSYLFWHGYLTWELESRIRNLGGKYQCFGMPYWSFTMESGRESNPLIFESGAVGGNGDPDNYHTVNGYSWPFTTQQFWTPTDCYADTDAYPVCSLKRALRSDFVMPTAEQIAAHIMDNPLFTDFTQYSHVSGQAVHLIDGDDSLNADGDAMYEFTQSYEPIWYLFHSAIQYHQALWVDCNDYDQIANDRLQEHPEAFTAFCNAYDTCTLNENGYPNEWLQWQLDDAMHFGGKLVEHEWSYVHGNALTVRKLYHLPKWNILYDVNVDDDIYVQVKDWCQGKLNSTWFVVRDETGQRVENAYADVRDVHGKTGNYWMMLFESAVVLSLLGLYWAYKGSCGKDEKHINSSSSYYLYGSMQSISIS